MFRLLVADLDSPSYFVATAAAELGYFEAEGIDVELDRAFGAEEGPKRLRGGTRHLLGGPAYAAAHAFPDCEGAKILYALSQYSYWFIAVSVPLSM
jgi:ABC-type nitrate/sulfonate/bicarbonate transport system substrate-binding protein